MAVDNDNDNTADAAGASIFNVVPVWAVVLVTLSIIATIVALIFCLSRNKKKNPEGGPVGNESPPPPYSQQMENKDPKGANGEVKKTNDVIVTVSKDGTETHIDRSSESDRDSQYSSDSSNGKKKNSLAFESRSIADSSDSFFNQYNEDGSFIGEYCLDDKKLMAPAVSLDTLGSLA